MMSFPASGCRYTRWFTSKPQAILATSAPVVAEDEAAGKLPPFTLRDGRPIMRAEKIPGEDVMNFIVPRLACIAALFVVQPCLGQSYPDKPVKMIVPFAAGGPTDVIARLVAQKLSEAWKQQ